MRQDLKMGVMSNGNGNGNGNGNYTNSNDDDESDEYAMGDSASLNSDDEKRTARLTKSNPYLSKNFLKELNKSTQHSSMQQQRQHHQHQQMTKLNNPEKSEEGGEEDEEFRSIEIVLNKENAAKLVAELQCKIECANRQNLEDIKFTFYL